MKTPAGRMSRGLLAGAVGLLLSACTINANIVDMPEGGISFSSFSKNTYSNKSTYEFDFSTQLKGYGDIRGLKVVSYESENCTGPAATSDDIDPAGGTARATGLQDGKKYSFRIQVAAATQTYQSPCTPWVGIDQQTPNPVSLNFPPANTYVAETKFIAQWNPTSDNGISGLSDRPYLIRLFSQASCSGTLLRTIRTASLAMEFAGLSQGDFYSYQILATDRAGNESPISCSPSTEIDIYAPGIRVSNPNSDPGYTSDRNVEVTITNDSWAGYWCLTEDPAFRPTGTGDACPGAAGGANGWSTVRPTDFTVSNGDGMKSIYVWLLDGGGTPRTNKQPMAVVVLDRVPPGTFSVTGITGGSDTILNDRLSDDADPTVHWTAATGASEYELKILDTGLASLCSVKVHAPDVEAAVTECGLQEGVPYLVRITARDAAGNTTAAPDFAFQKDLTPPGPFSIAGIDGGADTVVDAWSASAPQVHWSASADAVRYWISIREQGSQAPVCSEEQVADPAVSFDFAGGTCSALVSGASYEVTLRSEDHAGLTTVAGNSPFAFRADLDDPLLSLTLQPDALGDQTTATFEFSASDALSGLAAVECRWDAGAFAACTSPVSRALGEGTHQFGLRATDRVGNTASLNETFAIDLSNPVVTLTATPPAFSSSTNAHFTFAAMDVGPAGLDKVECQLDGGTWSDCFSPFDPMGLAPGAHTVKVRAMDRLAHRSAEAVHSWFIDVTAPALTLTSTPADGLTSTNASVSFTTADGETAVVSTECRWNGGAWTACSSPDSQSGLPVGLNTLSVRATNQAGLVSTQTYSWQIYSYSWFADSWGACDAAQPAWQTGAWGACDAAQPAWQAGGWSACNVTCGPGTQTRGVSCPVNPGNQWRSVSCPTTSGTQLRTVECRRNDGVTVADALCGGGKPAESMACSRNDCAGAAPAANLACSRGGGSDCHSMPATSQACDMGSCGGHWVSIGNVGGFDTNCPPEAYEFYTGGSAICPSLGATCEVNWTGIYIPGASEVFRCQ